MKLNVVSLGLKKQELKYPICFLQTKQKTFHTLKTHNSSSSPIYGVKHTQSRSMHPLQIPPPLPSSLSQTALACLTSLIHPRTAGKHKREENVQVDLQELVRNLIWTRSLAVSHENYNLKGTGQRRMVRRCRFSTESADYRQQLV